MCLVTNQQKPIILTEDMIVYKLLTTANHPLILSIYFNFSWTLNKKYKTKILKRKLTHDNFSHYDEMALESLFQLTKTKSITGLLICFREKNHGYSIISDGFHSFKTIERISGLTHHTIFECTIPKGSKIYEDTSGLIVSNQLIINKPI